MVSSRDEVRQLLRRGPVSRWRFSTEDEPLLDLIDEWLRGDDEHVNIRREVVLAVLGAELENVAGARRPPWERGNPNSFGQYFRNRKGSLGTLYGMAERLGRAGAKLVSFEHGRGGDLGDLGERRSGPRTDDRYDFEKRGGCGVKPPNPPKPPTGGPPFDGEV